MESWIRSGRSEALVTGWSSPLPNLSLRFRLTVLYLSAGIALLLCLTGGTYGLLRRYFDITTDLALQHRMAHELSALGAPLSQELLEADAAWYGYRDSLFPTIGSANSKKGKSDDEHDDDDRESQYDGNVSAIFVMPLSQDGRLLDSRSSTSTPIAPDQAAVTAALQAGHDVRTITTERGEQIRLLTYRVNRSGVPAIIQMGRLLTDQERLLSQVLLTLATLGCVVTIALGGGSWVVAGRVLRADADARERQQSFVANASHELRSPLALIRASAEFAKRKAVSESERLALLDDIIAETDYMSRLTDDLLLLSRLDTGILDFKRQLVAISTLFEDLVPQVQRLSGNKGISIVVSNADGTALADETRLRQVLLIVLENAIRFSPEGSQITLASHRTDRWVTVTVADEGPGIPAEAIPHVFDRFFQADTARGHQNGAGIGLSLAKALIDGQGGKITIRSETGKGTEVSILLPVAKS